MKHLDDFKVGSKEKTTTISFLISFILLVGYGVISKQGTNYALIVMILLAAVIAVVNRMEIDKVVNLMGTGMASQFNLICF